MQTSDAGIKFIAANEGFSATPFNDNGHPCWGHGHDQTTGEPVPESITMEEADALLRHDLATRFEPVVNRLIPPSCTQNQFDALVDFAYNLGPSALETMLGHGWSQVTLQIPRWNKSAGVELAGLTARRQKEVDLFNS